MVTVCGRSVLLRLVHPRACRSPAVERRGLFELRCARACQQTGWDRQLRHPLRVNEVRGEKTATAPSYTLSHRGRVGTTAAAPTRIRIAAMVNLEFCVRLDCFRARTSFAIVRGDEHPVLKCILFSRIHSSALGLASEDTRPIACKVCRDCVVLLSADN